MNSSPMGCCRITKSLLSGLFMYLNINIFYIYIVFSPFYAIVHWVIFLFNSSFSPLPLTVTDYGEDKLLFTWRCLNREHDLNRVNTGINSVLCTLSDRIIITVGISLYITPNNLVHWSQRT